MVLGVFEALGKVLGLYSQLAIAWIRPSWPTW